MVSEANYSKVLGDLRGALVRFKPGQETYDEIVATRDQVFEKYRPIFSSAHVLSLTKEEFTSFLYIENNRHWTGLNRKGLGAASDMEKLRGGTIPLRRRFARRICGPPSKRARSMPCLLCQT